MTFIYTDYAKEPYTTYSLTDISSSQKHKNYAVFKAYIMIKTNFILKKNRN